MQEAHLSSRVSYPTNLRLQHKLLVQFWLDANYAGSVPSYKNPHYSTYTSQTPLSLLLFALMDPLQHSEFILPNFANDYCRFYFLWWSSLSLLDDTRVEDANGVCFIDLN